MAFEPTLEEQELLAETFERSRSRMSGRELRAEALVAAAYAGAAAALWAIQPPHGFAIAPVAACILVLALSAMVRIDTPFGFTVPTQLAFVPLLFAAPVAVAPIAVVAALAIARLPDVFSGRLRASRLLLTPGNAWFAIGPVSVFAVAGVQPRAAGPALLVGALAAQFLIDFLVSVLRFNEDTKAGIKFHFRDAWVYAIDAALTPIAWLAAKNVSNWPTMALALVPLLGLLAVFARERHDRLESLLELNNAYRGTALVLGDVVKADDGYTGEHSKGVVVLALAVGRQIGLSAERRRNLEFAALLHDVGKIAIPKEIINKPGKLDPDEWTIIKTHTLEGQRMLDRVGGFMRDVGQIVRSHHERWDGRGYPDALGGEAIPLEARIIACCDAWNAMRTDRVYRKALSHEVALAELLQQAGSQFDPAIVEELVAVVAPARAQAAAGPSRPRPDGPPATPLLAAGAAGSGEREQPAETAATIEASTVEDVLPSSPVERLLEDSWDARGARPRRRELLVEALAGGLFLAVGVPLAVPALAAGRLPGGLALLLVGLYAVVARTVKFPLGRGSVAPSYLVLAPMLLLLPPTTVPLLAAAGMVLGSAARWIARRAKPQELLFALPDAWHTLGPAVVLSLAGPVHGLGAAGTYVLAFLAGCLVDLVSSTLRESVALGVAPLLQGRVMMVVWLVDACLAPAGVLIVHGARHEPLDLLLLLPLNALLIGVNRDRSARIAEAHRRLGLVARERTRLQAALNRLGDAFTAKLDLHALTDVVLHGAVDALDADAGALTLYAGNRQLAHSSSGTRELEPLLEEARQATQSAAVARQIERDGTWALGLPFALAGSGRGALVLARRERSFREHEQALMSGLVQRAQNAVTEVLAHETMRREAMTDPLTRLGNRRKLAEELSERMTTTTIEEPLMLMLFDLDGFKSYNDTFGHLAGDALLARLGHKLATAVSRRGTAYRLGGDEFCVLLPAEPEQLHEAVSAAMAALEEHGETFTIQASCGTVLLPHEATTADYALQLADKRMYRRKHGRRSGAREQAQDVLIHIMQARQPHLSLHADGVARLAVPVGRRLGMNGEQLDELTRAATLHDVGKVGIPDAILTKPGPLDSEEWSFMRQHTVLAERILSAAPALRPVATIVRATHERWDGRGYPDGLAGEEIPLAARIVAVCDAYQAMTTEQCYRPARTRVDARAELRREAARQFDPAVVAAFLEELDQPDRHLASRHLGDPDRAKLAAEVASHVLELVESRGSDARGSRSAPGRG